MDMWNYEQTVGNMKEGEICCSAMNTGLFNAMLDMADIRAVFCGHDHNNDFSG